MFLKAVCHPYYVLCGRDGKRLSVLYGMANGSRVSLEHDRLLGAGELGLGAEDVAV